MAEYIEREALKKELQKKAELSRKARYTLIEEDFVDIINDMPSADVAEVVRCKDCKYFTDEGDGLSYCEYHTDNAGYCDDACWVAENDFCSYGARMDGE